MIPGRRYDFVLTCTGHSHYTGRTLNGGERTIYRYTFVDREGRRYVASTGFIWVLRDGETYNIRATVKREEPRFKQTRLARLKVGDEYVPDLLALVAC